MGKKAAKRKRNAKHARGRRERERRSQGRDRSRSLPETSFRMANRHRLISKHPGSSHLRQEGRHHHHHPHQQQQPARMAAEEPVAGPSGANQQNLRQNQPQMFEVEEEPVAGPSGANRQNLLQDQPEEEPQLFEVEEEPVAGPSGANRQQEEEERYDDDNDGGGRGHDDSWMDFDDNDYDSASSIDEDEDASGTGAVVLENVEEDMPQDLAPAVRADRNNDKIRKFLCSVKYRHLTSWLTVEEIWNFMVENCDMLVDLKNRKRLKCLKTMRRECDAILRETADPKCKTVRYSGRGEEGETWEVEDDLTKLDRRKHDNKSLKERYAMIRCASKLPGLVKFLQQHVKHQCRVDYTKADVSVDGVQEGSKRPEYTMIYICIRFRGCEKPYVWAVLKYPMKDKECKPSCETVYGFIVDELIAAGIQLERLVADGLERKVAKMMVPPANYHCCDFCYAEGIKYPENPYSRVFYLSEHLKCPRRTRQQLIADGEIGGNLRQGENQLGVKGLTPLLRLENFDPIWQVRLSLLLIIVVIILAY